MDNNGLYEKYTVIKNSTGERVADCFVLCPKKDYAARKALEAYCFYAESKKLKYDLTKWLNYLHDEVPLEGGDIDG